MPLRISLERSFIGEAGAGQTSAILFTLIEACRRRQINPWEYLREVLTRLPSMTNRQLEDRCQGMNGTRLRPMIVDF